MVAIILGKGFEEMEAIVPCDMLRRAGVETVLAGIGGLEIVGSRGICVKADCTVDDLAVEKLDMVVLPGGLGGVAAIKGCKRALEMVQTLYQSRRYVAAICAAPTILAMLGITDGRKATCYPGMEKEMGNARMVQPGCAVRDDHVLTATAAGTAFDFGKLLIATLKGDAAAEAVAESIVLASC